VSGFWQKALGGAVQAPAAPQPVVHQERPWWDTTRPPVPQQAQQPVQQPYQPSPEPEYTTTKAKSARSSATCPECGSGNIFSPEGMPNYMTQCYECGYNPRFMHSTAGAGIPGDKSSPARPARQVSTANNFNPQTIVGRVGPS
jgi:hypothetical protein